MLEFEKSMDELTKNLPPQLRQPKPPEKSPEEIEFEQQLTAVIKLSAKNYQLQCKKLSNIQLASALINDALDLIQSQLETRSSAPI